jgi:tetratricopeptide (TPR) repeat protein
MGIENPKFHFLLNIEQNDLKILYILSKMGTGDYNEICDIAKFSKSTFYKWKGRIFRDKFIQEESNGKRTLFSLTPAGSLHLQDKLIEIGADFSTQLEILERDKDNIMKPYLDFIQTHFISLPDEVKVEFLELSKKVVKQISQPEKSMTVLVYLALNHPRFYPKYSIRGSDFLLENSKFISSADFDYFLQEITEKNFYTIEYKDDIILFFLSNSSFGQIVELIIKMSFEKKYYHKFLEKDSRQEYWLDIPDLGWDEKEMIVDSLIHEYHLFPEEMRFSVYQIANQYISKFNIETQEIIELPIAAELKKYTDPYQTSQKFTDPIKKMFEEHYTSFWKGLNSIDLLLSENVFKDHFREEIQTLRNKIKILLIIGISDLEELSSKTKIEFNKLERSILQAVIYLRTNDFNPAQNLGNIINREYPDSYAGIIIHAFRLHVYEQNKKGIELIQSYFSEKEVPRVLKLFQIWLLYSMDKKISDSVYVRTLLANYADSLTLKLKILFNSKHAKPNLILMNEMIEQLSKIEENDKNLVRFRIIPLTMEYRFDDAINLINNTIEEESLEIKLIKAEIYAKLKKYNKFEKELDDVLHQNPQHISATWMKSFIFLKNEETLQAKNRIDRILSYHPENPYLHLVKTIILLDLKEYYQALQSIKKSIELDPSFPESYIVQYRCISLYSSQTVASEYIEEVRDHWKDLDEFIFGFLDDSYLKSLIAIEKKQFNEALRYINEALEQDSEHHPENIHYLKVKLGILLNLKENDPALEIIHLLEQLSPNDEIIFITKAKIFLNKKEMEKSVRYANLAIKNDPDNPYFYYWKAQILFDFNRTEEALKEVERAIDMDPKPLMNYYLKYDILSKQKRIEETLELLNLLIKKDPSNTEPFYLKVHTLNALKRYNENLICIEQAQQINPKDPEFHYEKAIILQTMKEIKNALESINLALKYGNDDKFYNQKAYILKDLGRKDEAIRCIKKIIGRDACWLDSFGEILLYFKEYSEALIQLEKAISQGENQPWQGESYLKASVCYNKIGEDEKSEAYFKIGVDKAPKDDEWIDKAQKLIDEIELGNSDA